VRGALAALLSDEHDIEVVAELGRREGVLPAARRVGPGVVVLDHVLAGIAVVQDLFEAVPGCRVLALLDRQACGRVGHILVQLAPRAGLLSIGAAPEDFVDAIRRLDRGETVLDPDLAMVALRSGQTMLTDRERDVLRLAALGSTAREIGMSLCLSTGTVRNYLSSILTKLGARTRIEAIRIAEDAGWI
jgi:two-component system, NarL family, response regulator DesR